MRLLVQVEVGAWKNGVVEWVVVGGPWQNTKCGETRWTQKQKTQDSKRNSKFDRWLGGFSSAIWRWTMVHSFSMRSWHLSFLHPHSPTSRHTSSYLSLSPSFSLFITVLPPAPVPRPTFEVLNVSFIPQCIYIILFWYF